MSTGGSLALRAAAVVAAAGIMVGIAATVRTARPMAHQVPRTSVAAGPPSPGIITLNELSPTFQGPIQQKNNDEGWLVFTWSAIDRNSDPVRFRYRLNGFSQTSSALMESGDDGELSLQKAAISFSSFRGRLRRDRRGRVVLQSNPIDGPPYWFLEPNSEVIP
jgi:hypothetical protein